MTPLIKEARDRYLQQLLEEGVLSIDANGIPSNADKASKTSVAIAQGIANQLVAEVKPKEVGQTSGAKFESITMAFLENTFPQLQDIRPGSWEIAKLGNRSAIKTSSFAQYEHLSYLNDLAANNPNLAACIGNDYMVAPDIVVYRNTISDDIINTSKYMVDDSIATLASLRKENEGLPILHASISAKWTMRSDRAQNSRTEALGLIRNRKGHLPHIVVVTGEPLPSRIASLAMGTGDIDCVYHFALYELISAVKETELEDSIELLSILIDGKRLKDISDLPLDLAT